MKKELEICVRRMCQPCAGTGSPEGQPELRCAACNGSKYLERWISVDEFMGLYVEAHERAEAESNKRRADLERQFGQRAAKDMAPKK